MKNIHLIPTPNPSRLLKTIPKGNLLLAKENIVGSHWENQNIYITSDVEAKEGDWGYIPFQGGDVKLVGKYFADDWKKIILTTDQDLIKDGVQAIDDEFLEWFVKNPSCESVEIDKNWNYPLDKSWEYKIIIPKEEAKQLTNLEIAIKLEEIEREVYKPNTCDIIFERAALINIEEPKQETLEEAAENYSLELLEAKTIQPHEKTWIKSMFIRIARLQRERMYSEEEVLEIIRQYALEEHLITSSKPDIWFEQFKKK